MEPTALVEEQTFVSDVQTIPDTEGESVTPNEVLAEDDEVVGNEFIFQQVESLDNLFVENGREKPPKFINERYLLGSQMGEGSYGKVKQVLDTFTLQKMAVKIMNKQKLKKIPNGERNALNEFKIMRKLTHRNVVAVYDLLQREAEPILPQDGEVTLEEQSNSVLIGHRSVARKPEKLYLLMEYCLCGMYDLLQNAPDQKLPTWQAHKYFCDLMEGVEYLHSQRVIHKDIKPQNLLLSPDETLKITDFGVAEELDLYAKDASIKSSAGTPMFQPPEVASGKNSFCGFKLDVWCAGVTLYNFTTGHYPFEGHNLYILLENISKQPVHVPADLSPQLHSLLKFMLERNPRDRYSVAQVKSHRLENKVAVSNQAKASLTKPWLATDFGVAEELDLYAKDASIKSSAGTPMFQPPEVASGKNSFCGFKLDVWCAGVTLYKFTTGHYPFEGHNLYILLENISKQPVHVPADLSPQLHSLLKFMLERNPRDRYSVAQVKSHRWVVQKHCITPERVYLPNAQPPLIPHASNRSNSVDFMSSYGSRKGQSMTLTPHHNKNTLPLTANKSSASFNFNSFGGSQFRNMGQNSYSGHEFVSSLEKIFNLADSEVGNSKLEADDLMQVAGGGNQPQGQTSIFSKQNQPQQPAVNISMHDNSQHSPSAFSGSHKRQQNNNESTSHYSHQQEQNENSSSDDPQLPKIPTSDESIKASKKKQCLVM